MITLEEIKELQHKEIKNLSTKIIYLMIKNKSNDEGWSPISAAEFASATSMTTRAVFKVIRKLKACGLIEQKQEKERPNSTNEYRIIEL